MSVRARLITFGSAALLVIAGLVCEIAVGGTTGEVVAIALMSLGFGGAVLLVFYEVGLSEDRDRAREEERRREQDEAQRPRSRPPVPRWRRRP